MTTPHIAAVTFDCTDALRVATFWSEVFGRPVGEGGSSDFAQLPTTPPLMFFSVPEAKAAKNRVHLDIDVADLDGEVGRLVGLGATRLADYDENGFQWTTLADPEGNEFDLVQGSA
jgi:catechol 2,3-dioxygenase-like lactoylglutathione lyase family enzyme